MALLEQEERAEKHLGYEVEGQLLEVCTCNILCPCWVGEDPDGGTCDGVLAWHYDKGTVNGIDVAGRTFVILTHIPGNILKGNWRIVAYIDDGATDDQRNALLVLGAVMAGEKNLAWGRRLSAPLGVVLVAMGLGLLFG